jgi:glycine betaine/choline ABC-type transport system substrate-binding protein
VAISTGTSWDAGFQAIIPKNNTPESTGIKLTAAREITATVAVEALTAGKCDIFVEYVEGQ